MKTKNTMKTKKIGILVMMLLFFPVLVLADSCIDDSSANIFTGNSGSVTIGTGVWTLQSYCYSGFEMFFPYCEGIEWKSVNPACKCVNGACVGTFLDIFIFHEDYGNSTSYSRSGYIDDNLIESVVDSWLDN